MRLRLRLRALAHNFPAMRFLWLKSAAARWIGPALLGLAPLWLIGAFDRGLWTPDEPRVADIDWRMAFQQHWTLPQLAGRPFLEKPPLSYWASSLCVRLLGDSPDALRLPNLLYALIVALAIGALGLAMDGPGAALVAAWVAGSAVTALRVSMWLAPDACLLAACAVALLGAYLGYQAPPGRRKLCGYALMHAGAAAGFMAKSAVGWLVPGLTLLTLIAWERRWHELKRLELYAGFLLQALRVMFWYNLAGRFMRIAAPPAYQYANGHRNTFGKYFLWLPVYLLPWTALAVAAARRAWDRARFGVAAATPWRFATAAALPWLALLSLAATARDIYAAPAVLGFALLVGLWAAETQRAATGGHRALIWTRVIVTLLAGAFTAAVLTLAPARPGAPGGVFGDLAFAAAVPIGTAWALRRAVREQRRRRIIGSFAWTYGAFAVAFCLSAIAIFPAIDRGQNLQALAQRIHAQTRSDRLALLNPDETTLAMLDRGLLTRVTRLRAPAGTADRAVSRWFAEQGPAARVLVLLPGHAAGPFTPLLQRLGLWRRAGDGAAGRLQSAHVAVIARRYDLPQGRRYALLAPPGI